MSKPTNKPGWNPTDSSKVVEPSAQKKAQGWASGEKPAVEHFNWLMKNVSEWIDHVDVDLNSRISAVEARTTGTVQANVPSVTFPYGGSAAPSEYNAGRASTAVNGVKTIDWSQGASQFLLLDTDCALAFTGAVAGNTYYLRVQQNGGMGYYSITGWPQGTIWDGAPPTITKNVWVVDVIGVYFDGTNYFSSITKNFYNPPTVSTGLANGYTAGGASSHGGSWVSSVEKLSFANDTTVSTCQSEWGRLADSSYPSTITESLSLQGTQSLSHGYQMGSGSGSASRILKLSFANDLGAHSALSFGYNLNRHGIVQNTNKAIGIRDGVSSTSFVPFRFIFSSDTLVTLSTISAGRSVARYGGGITFDTYGIIMVDEGVSSKSIEKIMIDTETFSSLGTASTVSNSYGNEALYDANNGYFNRGGFFLRWDRVTNASALISITGNLRGSSAVQNAANGYSVGGAATLAGTTGTNAMRKLDFVTTTSAAHTATLTNPRMYAAGFEG